MELGHDMVDPLLEECPGGGEIRRSWGHGKLRYGSHEKELRKGCKKEGWWLSQEESGGGGERDVWSRDRDGALMDPQPLLTPSSPRHSGPSSNIKMVTTLFVSQKNILRRLFPFYSAILDTHCDLGLLLHTWGPATPFPCGPTCALLGTRGLRWYR